mmetsp:Transcript_16357/g.51406  ORF Transcript_16357/g.51406 Transcript_16357/m.51406 type:complete len:117 (-) Transcript_16357:160-510(-)
MPPPAAAISPRRRLPLAALLAAAALLSTMHLLAPAPAAASRGRDGGEVTLEGQREVLRGREVVWQASPRRRAMGVLFVAHGCSHGACAHASSFLRLSPYALGPSARAGQDSLDLRG